LKAAVNPEIVTIPIPDDNYAYCIISAAEAIVIDASDAEPVFDFINRRKLSLRMILSTHHHGDHTGGNNTLKKKTGCIVVGGDRRIAGIDRIVGDNEKVNEGPFEFEAIAVPGHTNGSVSFYFRKFSALFTGDTLFYAGCGRILEGTASQMFNSLKKIGALPLDTKIYCGHEYTLENLQFAKLMEPDNDAIDKRIAAESKLLDQGLPSGPSTLELELSTNPFMRVDQKTIRTVVGLLNAPSAIVFAELRKRKDQF
jgi:hydroxyacylglutathione hydrolase